MLTRKCPLMQESTILDLTTDDSEWMITFTWIIHHDKTICTIFWSLLHMHDGRAKAIAARFDKTDIDNRKVVGWSSNGCNSMLAASRIHCTVFWHFM